MVGQFQATTTSKWSYWDWDTPCQCLNNCTTWEVSVAEHFNIYCTIATQVGLPFQILYAKPSHSTNAFRIPTCKSNHNQNVESTSSGILVTRLWTFETNSFETNPIFSWSFSNSETIFPAGIVDLFISMAELIWMQGREGYMIVGAPITKVTFSDWFCSALTATGTSWWSETSIQGIRKAANLKNEGQKDGNWCWRSWTRYQQYCRCWRCKTFS